MEIMLEIVIAGAEEAYKALAIEQSLSIENEIIITGIKKKRTEQECSKQAGARSEFVGAIWSNPEWALSGAHMQCSGTQSCKSTETRKAGWFSKDTLTKHCLLFGCQLY